MDDDIICYQEDLIEEIVKPLESKLDKIIEMIENLEKKIQLFLV